MADIVDISGKSVQAPTIPDTYAIVLNNNDPQTVYVTGFPVYSGPVLIFVDPDNQIKYMISEGNWKSVNRLSKEEVAKISG